MATRVKSGTRRFIRYFLSLSLNEVWPPCAQGREKGNRFCRWADSRTGKGARMPGRETRSSMAEARTHVHPRPRSGDFAKHCFAVDLSFGQSRTATPVRWICTGTSACLRSETARTFSEHRVGFVLFPMHCGKMPICNREVAQPIALFTLLAFRQTDCQDLICSHQIPESAHADGVAIAPARGSPGLTTMFSDVTYLNAQSFVHHTQPMTSTCRPSETQGASDRSLNLRRPPGRAMSDIELAVHERSIHVATQEMAMGSPVACIDSLPCCFSLLFRSSR